MARAEPRFIWKTLAFKGKTMTAMTRPWRCVLAIAGLFTTVGCLAIVLSDSQLAQGGQHSSSCSTSRAFSGESAGRGEEPHSLEVGGAGHRLRSPEQEKRVVISL